MKYVYASRSGNVEKIVQALGLEALKLQDGSEKAGEDFILFTYTDGKGVVPAVVDKFLKENHGHLKGVVVSGSMQRHADTFCAAGQLIAKAYGVPVLAEVDGAGKEEDYKEIQKKLA
ncbi:MAG: class Ib ribonucleoside-diphosphate reductase assembly flavoprotein NrdI [Eubacteriales bacterium]|nr:class Ib ribonucleoside-diphosphate reductase assembly flavoprotein NrdI [Eubacteriales bacterium]